MMRVFNDGFLVFVVEINVVEINKVMIKRGSN